MRPFFQSTTCAVSVLSTRGSNLARLLKALCVAVPLAVPALCGCSSSNGAAVTSSGAGAAAVMGGANNASAGAGALAGTGGAHSASAGASSAGAGPSSAGAGGSNSAGAGAPSSAGASGSGSAGASNSAGSSGTGSSGAGSSGAGSSGASSSGGAGAVDTTKMAAAMGFGTNLGNTFDNTTTWETGWGEPLVTQPFIQALASHGIKTVRVPVAWNTYASAGVIDASKLARVKEVVGWIQAAGMYSIVNIHWDGGWIDNESNANKYKLTDDVKTKFASYWMQIASAMSSVGTQLVFEGLNEEGKFYVNGDTNQAPDYAALNQLNQLFVSTVRAQGGYNQSRALLIAGFTTDIDLTCVDAFSVPTDPAGANKLFLSIHYYTPYTFTGLDTVETWGSPATTWGTSAEKTTLDGYFSKLSAFSAQKKIPVIIGEFGVTRGTNYVRDSASRVAWMDAVAKAALSRGMVPVLWDTGSEIKRTDGSFSTELQTVMTDIK